MEAIQIFNYNESNITFKGENGVAYVNAAEMGKPFGKRPVDYLRLPSTIELLNAIVRKSHNSQDELVITKRGSSENGGGTWFHEDVAIDYAQWLSVDFRLWVNDRIKELLKYGMTATPEKLEDILTNPDLLIGLATELKKAREEKALLESEIRLKESELSLKEEIIEIQDKNLKAIAPKAEYVDQVLLAKETYAITRIAQELGMSAVRLNQKLAEKKVIRKVDGQWILFQPYLGKGYTKAHTVTYQKSDGTTGTNTQTVWTEQGRKFIHDLFKQ